MTWGQYHRYAIGYQVREDKEWRRTRLIAWAANSPYRKDNVTPRTYYESIFDTGAIPITAEEYDEIRNAWKLN